MDTPEQLQYLEDFKSYMATANAKISEVSSFTQKHFIATIGLVVVLAVAIVGGTWGMLSLKDSLNVAEVKMTQADTNNHAYLERSAAMAKELKVAEDQIAAITAAQTQRQQVIVVRDQQAAAQIAQVTRPGISAVQALQDFTEHKVVSPGLATLTDDGRVAIEVPGVQQVTALKIEHDQFKSDLDDVKSSLADEQTKFGVCTKSVDDLKDLNNKCEVTKANYRDAALAYEKAAKKTKWRRFLDGAVKFGGFTAGVLIGSRI